MAHSGPDADVAPRSGAGFHPRRVSGLARLAGTVLLVAAGPAVLGILGYAIVEGSFLGRPLAWLAEAMATPLGSVGGSPWAFHAAALVGLCGVWAYGLALLVEGLFGLD